MSLAARGVRALTALATGDAAAASRAVDDATALLLDDDDDASRLDAARAFDAPHGAVVAMALKTLAHWSALTGEGDGKSRGAIARYRRAAAAAEEAADAPSNDACVSAMFADALLADVQLARAQHLVRVAASGGDLEDEEEEEEGEERPRDEDAALAAAEAAAAAAVTSAEALGDPAHPRVGLAIACSGDVYVYKATAAARRGGGAGGGATGDGAGVLFAEGAFYTLVPIRPRWRGGRRSLRTFAVVSLRPPLPFNTRPRRLSTPLDAFQLHPSGANRALPWRLETARHAAAADGARARPGRRVRRRRERAPAPRRVARAREVLRHLARERREQARSISHWSPYDRVGAVDAHP